MLHSSQRSQDATSNRTRAPRLRSACNLCCAAKVKCSSERSGCKRCRDNGTQCVYGVSRVGKVPGIRAKKKQNLSNPEQQHQEITRPTTSSIAADEIATTDSMVAPEDLGLQPHDRDTITAWVDDWDFDAAGMITSEFADDSSTIRIPHNGNDHAHIQKETDASEFGMTTSSTITASSSQTFSPPFLDSSLKDLLMHQQGDTPGDEQARDVCTSPTMVRPRKPRPRTEIDSRICLECCQMIADLESYMLTELKAFKIIVGVVRQALDKVSHLIGQLDSGYHRCLLLFTTLMYQILDLLEVCTATVEDERKRQNSISIGNGSSSIFGFGHFSVDAEEQKSFQFQRILKEAQQAAAIVDRLRTLAGVVGPGSPSSVFGEGSVDCYSDLSQRFTALAAQLTARHV